MQQPVGDPTFKQRPASAGLISRRGFVGGSAGAVMLATLAACTSSNVSVDSSSKTTTLNVGLEAESIGLVQTGETGGYSTYLVFDAIYDPIVRLDLAGNPYPFLAQSVTPNAAFDEWTIKLRPNVRYSDGTPFAAKQLAEVFAELQAPTAFTASTYAFISKVTVVDDLTLLATLTEGNQWFDYVMAFTYPFKPGLQKKYGSSYGSHPIGTGPFKLDSWELNVKMQLSRNPYYWGVSGGKRLPLADNLVFMPIVDASARLAALTSGSIDIMMSSNAAILSQAGGAGMAVNTRIDNSGYGFFFNTTKPPVDDVRIRRALAYATNRPAVVAAGGGDKQYQVTRYQYFAPGSPWFSPAVDAAALKFNLAKAKALVQEYVSDPSRSDGLKPGSPVTLEMKIVTDANTVDQSQAAQAMWGAAGVKVTLKEMDQDARIEEVAEGDFQSDWQQWGEQDPYDVFRNSYGDAKQTGTNYARYVSPTIVANIESLRTASASGVDQLVSQIGMIIDSEVPMIPIGSGVMGFAYPKTFAKPPTMYSGQAVYQTNWGSVLA